MLPRWIVIPLLAAAFVLAAVRSMATILAGGGPLPDGDSLKSECYLYAEVAGTHQAKMLTTCPLKGQQPPCYSSKFLVCTDGDPTCDQDRTCNGVCVFRARVCTQIGRAPRLPADPARHADGIGVRGVRGVRRAAQGPREATRLQRALRGPREGTGGRPSARRRRCLLLPLHALLE